MCPLRYIVLFLSLLLLGLVHLASVWRGKSALEKDRAVAAGGDACLLEKPTSSVVCASACGAAVCVCCCACVVVRENANTRHESWEWGCLQENISADTNTERRLSS